MNKKSSLLVAGLVALAIAHPGYAQKSAPAPAPIPTPTSQEQGIGLSFNGSFSGIGKSKFKSGNTKYNEASSTAYSFGVSQVIPFGQESALETSLGYTRESLKFEKGNNAVLPLPKRLQSLSLGFNYSQPINSEWSTTLGTGLVSASAGSGGFKSKGFGVDVFAAATYKYSPTLSLTGGVAYSSLAKGTTQFLPVIGVNWTPSPQWTVALGIPETGVIFQFSESFSLGLILTGSGGAYYVEVDPLPGAAGKPNLSRTTLDYFAVGTALKATWQAGPGFGVTASVGSIFQSEYEYEARKLKIKSDGGGAYYELGLNFAF